MPDYKRAYQALYKSYKSLLKERMETAALPQLIDWINDPNRGPAVLSFTEGPERQLAYHIESMLLKQRDSAPSPE